MEKLISDILFIGSGVITTIKLLLGGICLGLTIGIIFTILRHKKIAVSVINRIISIVRGTPLILQLSFIYFSAPGLIGVKLDIITAGIVAFGLNSSAYVSEISRQVLKACQKDSLRRQKPYRFRLSICGGISFYHRYSGTLCQQWLGKLSPY